MVAATALTGAMILLAIMIAPFLSYVPAWDAGWYLACLLNAVEVPFSLKNFNCAGHVSAAYTLLISAGQYVSFGSMELLHLSNLMLWIVACAAIARSVRLLSGKQMTSAETLALMGVLVLDPTGLSHVFHLNTDFAVATFGAVAYLALLERKAFLAAAAGTLMCFSKEVGVAYYLGLWGLSAFLLTSGTNVSLRGRSMKIFVSGLPLAFFGLRTLVRFVRHPDQPLFFTYEDVEKLSTSQMVLDINPLDPTMQGYLADLLVLNFHWILSIVAFAGLGYLVMTRGQTERGRAMWSAEGLFAICAALGAVYLVTRVRPFNHVRYTLTALPPLLVISLAFFWILVASARARAYILAALSVLWVASNLRTVDPGSRAYFGTFPVGRHEMLNMASHFFETNAVREHFNRDELVYNLEYLRLHQLADAVFADIGLTGELAIMGSRDSKFFWPGMIDAETKRRVARRTGGVFMAHYLDSTEEFQNVVEKPRTLYYLEFPNMLSRPEYAVLKTWYEYRRSKVYSIDGYELVVHEFAHR